MPVDSPKYEILSALYHVTQTQKILALASSRSDGFLWLLALADMTRSDWEDAQQHDWGHGEYLTISDIPSMIENSRKDKILKNDPDMKRLRRGLQDMRHPIGCKCELADCHSFR